MGNDQGLRGSYPPVLDTAKTVDETPLFRHLLKAIFKFKTLQQGDK